MYSIHSYSRQFRCRSSLPVCPRRNRVVVAERAARAVQANLAARVVSRARVVNLVKVVNPARVVNPEGPVKRAIQTPDRATTVLEVPARPRHAANSTVPEQVQMVPLAHQVQQTRWDQHPRHLNKAT